MEKVHRPNSTVSTQNFIWIGLGLGVLYWLLESLMHITVFGEGPLLGHVFTPDVHEIWKRLSILGLIILFSVYAQRSINIRRRTEAALADREQELSRILENNPAGILLVESESRKVTWANNNALKMIGTSREAVQNHPCQQFLCPSEIEYCPILDSGREIDLAERELITSQGKLMPILKSVTKVNYNGREHLLEAFFDLSDRKEMEEDLKQAHAELDQIFQTASVAMRLVDTEFNVLKINKTFVKLSGVSEAEAIGKKCHEIFSGPSCFTEDCALTNIIANRETVESYIDKTRPDGESIPCILTATPFLSSDGKVVGIVESFRDITDLKKAQNAIESERDKLERILSHLHEGVSIITRERIVEYQNEKFYDYFGHCKGRPCHEAIYGIRHPCAPCLMEAAFETGRIQMAEFETQDGRFFEKVYTPVRDIDSRKKVVSLWRDVTEKKAASAAIMRAEQMAVLGELAAGVAHEINNPINGIINYAQILANKSEEGSKEHEISKRLINEGDRIARIVEGLLSFARRHHEDESVISIAEIISDSIMLTAAQLRRDNITIKTDISDELPELWGRAHEIEQVFVNVISNARHALNEKYPEPHNDKILEIMAESLNHEDTVGVRIFFKDSGVGIPAYIIKKVTKPFFTTKTEGKRTGLGLSISQAILEEHGGQLVIESQEGSYTKVIIELPGQSKA